MSQSWAATPNSLLPPPIRLRAKAQIPLTLAATATLMLTEPDVPLAHTPLPLRTRWPVDWLLSLGHELPTYLLKHGNHNASCWSDPTWAYIAS